MRIGRIEVKRRVWVGLICGAAATGVWWARSRGDVRAPEPSAQPRQPFVVLTRPGAGSGDQVLRERAEFFDPSPLFFPTERNYGQSALRESMRRQPGEVFGSFDAEFNFPEQNIKSYNADTTAAPERLADVLAPGDEAPFSGIGQVDIRRADLAPRSGYLEVRSLADGKLIVAQMVTSLAMPRSDFAPLEFLVVVSSIGLVGDPVLVATSGVEEGLEEGRDEMDAFLRNYLVKTMRLGERLSPGRYRVLIGP